jgi:hypothetical protein
MKAQLTAAAAISILLNTAPASAGEPQFNVPATARAQESAELLTQAAHALYDSSSSRVGARGTQVSNLWLYPTGDADTVFAQFTLTSKEGGASPTEHLAMLTVRNERIVEQRELLDESAERYAPNERSPSAFHWSTSIGNGLTLNPAAIHTAAGGVPAPLDWTATIGNGSTVRGIRDAQALLASEQPPIANLHWTSKIGTGHATESADRVTTKAPTVVADQTSSTAPAL